VDEAVRIRRLERGDDRTALRCGDARLDEFLRRYAAQNQFRHHLGVTYVAVDEPSRVVVGYVTLSAASVASEILPPERASSSAYAEVPVVRIARLAVDQRAQGCGLGSELLRYALELARVQAASVGCVGVVVDAKPEAVGFYARYGFTSCRVLQGGANARPRQELLFLPLSAVEAALDE
jgi:GNAT superfamily N-acetyltransferase